MGTDDKIREYMKNIRESRFADPERERASSEELLACSLECRHVYGIGFAYTYLLDYYIQIHDSERCPEMARRAMEYTQVHGQEDLLMQVYNSCGIYCCYIHDDIIAFEYFIKSLEIAEKLEDTVMKYRLYNNMAVSFHNKKDYKSAFCYYEQAYEMVEDCREDDSLMYYQMYLLENLINCSISMDEADQTEEYCLKLKEFLETYPKAAEDPSLTFQKAIVLAYFKRKDEAIEILRKALSWKDKDPLDVTDVIDLYPHVFELLLTRREKELSWKVLKSLTSCMEKESTREKQDIAALTIRYYQTFDMETELMEAFVDYYLASQEALVTIAQNQIDAMKEKLASFEVERKLIRLQRLSYTDELCQINNRRYYEELLARTMEDSGVQTMGLIIVDIDYFKEYNDFYGHQKGDEVLRKVAQCLIGEAPEGIVPCRYGGDEFCCVCSNVEEEGIRSYLDAVRKRLSQGNIPHSASMSGEALTLSCGYSLHEAGDIKIQELFDEADRALYWAKAGGRDQYLGYGYKK